MLFQSSHPGDEALLVKRRQLLAKNPARHLALLPKGAPLLDEFARLLSGWGVVANLQTIGQEIAPDYLLLKPNDAGMPMLLGGCVCFPSSWAFEEKVGQPLDWIHAVVPTLNEKLDGKVRSFLTKMTPGHAWCRANWGLTASPKLNQHPSLKLPQLTANTPPETISFRIEQQALIALPKTNGILFGIRLEVVPLAEVRESQKARKGLLNALKTMPAEIAKYKNLSEIQFPLIRWLQA